MSEHDKQLTDKLLKIRERITGFKQKSSELEQRISQKVGFPVQADKADTVIKTAQVRDDSAAKEINYLRDKVTAVENEKMNIESKFNDLTNQYSELKQAIKSIEEKNLNLSDSLQLEVLKNTAFLDSSEFIKISLKTTLEFIRESIRFFRLPRGMAHEILVICMKTPEFNPSIKSKMELLVKQFDKLNNAVTESLKAFDFEKELQLREFELNRFVDSAVSNFMYPFKDKGITLIKKINFENNINVKNFDTNLLSEAIRNLLQNSTESVSKLSNLDIEIATEQTEHEITVRISDNGTGIPPHLIDKVINPFVTTKENHYGLGLTRTYWIMKIHKGDIRINSIVNKGTTVELSIQS